MKIADIIMKLIGSLPQNTQLRGVVVPGAIPIEMTLARSGVNAHPGHSHEEEFVQAFNDAWDAKHGASSSSKSTAHKAPDKSPDINNSR